jgi:hypothetical protein
MDDMDETDGILSALQIMAVDYRSNMRMHDKTPLLVTVPNWYAQKLIEHHGSLQAAADSIFIPGTVRIIDAYWENWCFEMQERINRRFGHSTTKTP